MHERLYGGTGRFAPESIPSIECPVLLRVLSLSRRQPRKKRSLFQRIKVSNRLVFHGFLIYNHVRRMLPVASIATSRIAIVGRH